MAERVIRQLVDDVDGATTDDVQRVTLGWDGGTYEVDLGPEHRAEVEAFLRPYLAAGRRVRTQQRPRAGTSSASSSTAAAERQAIRAWATEQGIEVPKRGPLPQSLRDQYARSE